MAGLPPLDPAKMQLVQELEIEMMSDMYNRMTNACHRKCIPPKYKDAELGKGEAVCIDRCIAKYLDIHERVGKKLTELSMQDDEVLKKIQAEQARMSALHSFVKENILLAMIETSLEKRNSTLNLSNFEIKEIPNLVFRLKDLSKLYLSRNFIENLPEQIFEFPYLKVLALDYNAIASIPPGLEKLAELTDLNLSHNNLRHLTPEIGKLAKLELLWVNHTRLESLPPEIGNCTYLDTFGARGNFLTELPPEIGKLRHLRWLTLEGNLLKKIPEEISQLKNLIHLNLSHNQLETFPKIENLHKLQFVYLSHNFIKEVDAEVLQKLSYVSKIDLSDNTISKDDPCLKGVRNVKIDDSFVMPQEETEHGDSYSDSDADSDSNDWELSVPSSILNLSQSSVEEMQLDDIFESALPQVARFSAIGS